MIKHVVCAVSGGVDSAVSALLLKRRRFNVTGVFMRNWDVADETGHCTADKDAEDAAYVCSRLGIPFHEVNFVREYWNNVFSQMVEGYERGMTPNPDVLCNRHIKFGHLFDYATEHLGADAVATGHYARNSAGQFLENPVDPSVGVNLLVSADPLKDQTLFLSQIHQRALRRTMFPVGGFKKSMVKQIASDAGLDIIVRKKESTGICFIGKRHFPHFMEHYIEPRPGNFVDIDTGAVVGKHKGVHLWTMGQRTLLGGLNRAYFVASRDPTTQTILVASGTDHPALFSRYVTTDRPHWINVIPAGLVSGVPFPCRFRFQHTHPLIDCRIQLDERGDTVHVELSHELRAISPGQYAVFYIDDKCLGSARILHVGPSLFELRQRQKDAVENNEHAIGDSVVL